MEKRDRVVVVTGASSGIGNACATHLAKKGYKVYGTCRNPGSYVKKADEFFELIPLDLANETSVAKAADTVLAKDGRIDVLVCNAGTGLAGSVEDCSTEEIGLQMETNFLGTVRTIKSYIPTMRSAGAGRILVMSSIAGLAGLPFHAFYSASKHALEGFVESLRFELRPFGVEACLIEPGHFRTGFSAARVRARHADDESLYKKYFDAAMGAQEKSESAGTDPLVAARLVYRLIEARHLPLRVTVGPGVERLATVVKRLVPGAWFEKLYRLYYKLP